ncbi:UrcA family protein [Sphingobium bisphenolivorans]|uniref:UrcA family protein n=1 Tax=Sphingobium bisphenolivorans TaxID=1335760 RepID=UPI00039F8B75|nr:UrcA family protein [Sphingobium bisphenolivorans]
MTGKTLAALAATMTFALPTTIAFAASTDANVVVDGRTGAETRSIEVSVADLNLASAHGARLADSRITRAAKKVCGWQNGSIMPATRDYRTCFGDALDGARSDLGALVQGQRQG